MKNFFDKSLKNSLQELLEQSSLSRDTLLYRVMPHLLIEIVTKYFRLELEGAEHLPKKGRAILLPNHSGYAGFDAVILGHEIYKNIKRIPRVMTHHLWFLNEAVALPAQKMGFVEATSSNGQQLLEKNNIVVLFPEGEYGNFKPTRKRYRLQEFKRGFIRLAILTGAPIVPILIVGAEETHINLRQLKFSKHLFGAVLPLPLNILPLPAKWKIIVMEPIVLPYKPSAAEDQELVHEIASDVREKMQKRLNQEISKREYIYFKKIF